MWTPCPAWLLVLGGAGHPWWRWTVCATSRLAQHPAQDYERCLRTNCEPASGRCLLLVYALLAAGTSTPGSTSDAHEPLPSIPLLAAVAMALALVACTSDTSDTSTSGESQGAAGEQSPATTIDLVRSGACGDAFFWAESADGDTAVTVDVAYSRPADLAVTLAIPFTLPDRSVKVRVLEGQDLSRNFCTDLIDMSSQPESTSPAVAGHGRVTIAPPPGNGNACGRTLGTLRLKGLVAEDGTEFSPITVESRDIGCLLRVRLHAPRPRTQTIQGGM